MTAFADVEVSNQTEQFVVEALRAARALTVSLGAKGFCLVRHPGYYRRFGFENSTELVHEGVPPEVFFALALEGSVPRGVVHFHEAFGATG